MKLFRLRTVADLTRNYIISSSKLKVAHWSIHLLLLLLCKIWQTNKTYPVTLKDLNVGQFNGNLWFTCSDVLPLTK